MLFHIFLLRQIIKDMGGNLSKKFLTLCFNTHFVRIKTKIKMGLNIRKDLNMKS